MAEMIDDLAVELAQAKSDENAARQKRILIEERIVELLEMKASDRCTINTSVGLRVVVETGYNYKLDKDFDRSLVPHKETVKIELDARAYNALPEQEKALASKWVTATPKKPSVTLAII
jgi:hypothetical protein